MTEQIALFIGQIILAGGGAVAITFGFIKWFGQKWFESQFAESLELFKREQSEILEQYRYQINARFNRISKIHEKEFEVLPLVWSLLQDAYGHFISITNPFQQWPDLNKYNPDELESFLEKCELLDFQKNELRNSKDKLKYYKDTAYWIRLNIASAKFQEYRNYLRYNKIFLSLDLFDLFHQIEKAMISAQVELEEPDNRENPWRGTLQANKSLSDTVIQLMEQVESAVQKRLHFDQA